MIHPQKAILLLVLALLTAIPCTIAHGHGDESDEAMGMEAATPVLITSALPSATGNFSGPIIGGSYFTYPSMGGTILGHIVVMTIAWFLILPIGIMLSVARSRLALPTQICFLGVHSLGLVLGSVYTHGTPDLYENNSHNKIGWIITWIVVGQCFIGIMKLVMDIGKPRDVQGSEEEAAFLPISIEAIAQRGSTHDLDSPNPYRYSNDSGHYTASRSQSVSSAQDQAEEEQQRKLRDYEASHHAGDDGLMEKRGLLGGPKVDRFAQKVSVLISSRTMKVMNVAHNAVDRLILLPAFITFVSGMAVYGGVFRGVRIFSGLAHTIKGGIFFWYGLLTLGRWMGCFSEYGWAWNVKPPVGVISKRQAMVPSAEFTESFVIFLYGSTNVFLEHLAAWGEAWSAQDLEHVSISIMFLGGGLAGMLVESTRVRDLLNSVILTSPAAYASQFTRDLFMQPRNYRSSMNPFPALIILLLGLMMSSHHQNSMVATMVHKQWGTLFMGFAIARAVTYILSYLSPPASYLPSRPPSELITSFCLISGGIIFMASNTDTVSAMEQYNIHAMFPFTVTMGFTAFLMAWVIIVLAVKGWAVRRQSTTFISGGFA